MFVANLPSDFREEVQNVKVYRRTDEQMEKCDQKSSLKISAPVS